MTDPSFLQNMFGSTNAQGQFQPNQNALGMVAGFANTLDTHNPKTDLSEATRAAATMGLNAVAPGLGTAADTLGKITQKFTRNEDGTYKSTFAGVVENSNPINLLSNVASGDPLGKKKQRRLKREKKIEQARRKAERLQQRNVDEAAYMASTADMFTPVFQKGGSLKKPCGCNKDADGIDTDIFKKFNMNMMKKIQRLAGTTEDGFYKEEDKINLKKQAARYGMKLVNYVTADADIKNYMQSIADKAS